MSRNWRYAVLGFLAGAAVVGVLGSGFVTLQWRATEEAREEAEERRWAIEAEREQGREVERLRAALTAERDARRRAETRAAERGVTPALDRGIGFLLRQQSPDGAWRSDTYATFKDGTALTPLVVCALLEGEPEDVSPPEKRTAIRKASESLAKLVKPDGAIDAGEFGFDYPVYTAALTVKALSHPANKDLLKARDAWLKYLLDRQLSERLGWAPADKQYGGWGYCRVVPKKPEPNVIAPTLIESNLSATVFALEALRAADVTDPERYRRAETFLHRCQNEDGGFFFIYDDPVRNKAGSPDPPTGPQTRFHSYGSTTADGVLGMSVTEAARLRRKGELSKQGIVVRANPAPMARGRDWLLTHFRADSHPGVYVEAHERNREAVYYYYAASAAKALRVMKVEEAGGKPWAPELAAELTKRQRADGSWSNPVELVRENEPLVATSHALIALANCNAALGGK
jgi:squalene-hopene/tetraprenyl-beta-curcumene cyclase